MIKMILITILAIIICVKCTPEGTSINSKIPVKVGNGVNVMI